MHGITWLWTALKLWACRTCNWRVLCTALIYCSDSHFQTPNLRHLKMIIKTFVIPFKTFETFMTLNFIKNYLGAFVWIKSFMKRFYEVLKFAHIYFYWQMRAKSSHCQALGLWRQNVGHSLGTKHSDESVNLDLIIQWLNRHQSTASILWWQQVHKAKLFWG